LIKENIISSINQGNRQQSLLPQIREELRNNPKTIVILDDDPTGTQTVYDVPVITSWEESVLVDEIVNSPIFFILTNSRSLQVKQANELAELIGSRLHHLSKKHKKELVVVSRGDSTLRGHYPNEIYAQAKGMGLTEAKHILIPAFFEGGRYTFNDIHYVKDGEDFIPAHKTPFAKDNTFGYKNSNLKDWIVEKNEGKINRKRIQSVSLEQLRSQSTKEILKKLKSKKTSHLVFNATSYFDLEIVALNILKSNQQFLLRTSASFVNAITSIEAKEPLSKSEILSNFKGNGSLTVIGSYVPKTTAQLSKLKEESNAIFIELDVTDVRESILFQQEIDTIIKKVNSFLLKDKDVVLHTSRTIIKGETKAESLKIVNNVSQGIISIIKQIQHPPKYIIAKGGITSSDIATKGLNVKRAYAIGQAIKGVPVWKLGDETKFPGLPYIIFPGNVGNTNALYQLTKLLK